MSRATVVLATHNPDPALLRRQIESLVAQSVQDWRCLVFDDASADPEFVRSAVAVDQRFHMLNPLRHRGHYAAFELLLTEAAGNGPVVLCDQDDYWHSDKLETLLPVLEGGAAGAFSSMRVVDTSGELVRERFLDHDPDRSALRPASLLVMNCVSGTALAVSSDTIRAALPFPRPEARGWHDQWLAAIASRIGSLEYIAQPLVDYTEHAGQVVGEGLRKVNARRVRAYAYRTRSVSGLRHDLVSRVDWVSTAAVRLLELPGPEDPALEILAQGQWSPHLLSLLWDGWRSGDVPASRAALLAAGFGAKKFR